MSHGPIGEASKAEPNLIPLLDVVFQLIMFFLMCVNFVSERADKDIQLPVAQSARPLDKRASDFLFLNLTSEGHLKVLGSDPLTTPAKWRGFLKQQYADSQRLDRTRGGTGEVKTIVIIRADKRVHYKLIYDLLQECKGVGYRKLQVRAESKGV